MNEKRNERDDRVMVRSVWRRRCGDEGKSCFLSRAVRWALCVLAVGRGDDCPAFLQDVWCGGQWSKKRLKRLEK
jgi:hypothetical protein